MKSYGVCLDEVYMTVSFDRRSRGVAHGEAALEGAADVACVADLV